MGKNQYTVGLKPVKNTGNKGAYSDKDGLVLTPRQKRLFWNVASGRFKTVIESGVDAGYAMTSAMTNCQALVRQYSGYIEELRQEFLAPQREQAQKDAELAKRILKDLALSSANDQVKRLACRDLLELNGELKTLKPDKTDDVTPRDLKQEAQRAAQSIATQTKTTETVSSVSKSVSDRVN